MQVALTDVRRLVDGLRPPALDELGLVGAIEQQAERLTGSPSAVGGIRAVVVRSASPLPDLPAAVEVAAYRIAIEALTNAVRHSGATICRVEVDSAEDLEVTVTDDGHGLPPALVSGTGIESMRDRAAELGGTLVLERPAVGGLRVVARLPLQPTSTLALMMPSPSPSEPTAASPSPSASPSGAERAPAERAPAPGH